MRRLATWVIALTLVGTGVGCSDSHRTVAPAPRPAATPAQAADALALRMMDAVALPAGAQRYEGALPAILTSAGSTPAVTNLVREHRTWTAPQSASTLRFFKFTPTSHGFTYQGGAGSTETPSGKAWTFDSQFATLPLNVALTQLDVAVTTRVGGGSVIRVDAMASWTRPKPRAEYVPADDRVAIVTALHPSSPPSVFRRAVVTDPRRIAVLKTSFDRMRLAAEAQFQECGAHVVQVPDLGGGFSPASTIHEVAFSTSTRDKPNLVIVLPTCGGVGVRARDVLQPTLQYDETFGRMVTNELMTGAAIGP